MYSKDDIMKKLVDHAVVGLPPAVANLAKTIAAKARRNGYSLKGARTSQLQGTLNALSPSLSLSVCSVCLFLWVFVWVFVWVPLPLPLPLPPCRGSIAVWECQKKLKLASELFRRASIYSLSFISRDKA